jgi:DNA-binding FadR family transcriptional regulator
MTPHLPNPLLRVAAPVSSDEADTLSVLAPIARSSIVDAVVERIRGEILSGRLAAGSRLPSERELALALGINRLTLRAALARLEAMGLVLTRHGAGTVVASWRERAGLDALGALARGLPKDDPARGELLAAILEVRRVLGAEAVALAARRATPEDIAGMRVIAEAQRHNLNDPVAMARGDVAFQRAVVRAAGNVGLELILNTFARFPDEHPDLVAQLYDEPQRTLDHYPLVIGLIEARDDRAARDLVRGALEVVDEELVRRHSPAPQHSPAKPGKRKRESKGGKR